MEKNNQYLLLILGLTGRFSAFCPSVWQAFSKRHCSVVRSSHRPQPPGVNPRPSQGNSRAAHGGAEPRLSGVLIPRLRQRSAGNTRDQGNGSSRPAETARRTAAAVIRGGCTFEAAGADARAISAQTATPLQKRFRWPAARCSRQRARADYPPGSAPRENTCHSS